MFLGIALKEVRDLDQEDVDEIEIRFQREAVVAIKWASSPDAIARIRHKLNRWRGIPKYALCVVNLRVQDLLPVNVVFSMRCLQNLSGGVVCMNLVGDQLEVWAYEMLRQCQWNSRLSLCPFLVISTLVLRRISPCSSSISIV